MKNFLSKLIVKKSKPVKVSGFSVEDIKRFHSINDDLIPIINRAKDGSVTANYDLYRIFYEGKEVEKDLHLASYYLLGAMNAIGNDLEDKANRYHYLSLLVEVALIKKEMGDYETMKKAFYDCILFMQKYLPFEEWDFSIFETIKENLE